MEENSIQKIQTVADVLLERGLASQENIIKAEEFAAKNGVLIEDALLAMNVAPEIEMVKIAGEVFSLPFFDSQDKKIPFIVLSTFPEEVARKYNMIAFEVVSDNMVKVALARPWDPTTKRALDFIRKKNHLELDPYIISPSGLKKILEQYKNPVIMDKVSGAQKEDLASVANPQGQSIFSLGEKKESPKTQEIEDISELIKEDVTSKEQLIDIMKSSTIPRTVAAIIKYAVFLGASDIHVEPMEQADTRIRYRMDGMLNHIIDIPKKDHAAFVSRIKISAKLKIDEQRVPQDGRIDVRFEKQEIDLRVSTFPTIHGEKVVMRILDKSGGIITVENLGMTGRTFDLFLEAIQVPNGILLVTGPTGSGKSTTLYAAISRINKEGVNIVTLEDPVEYQMEGVNQSQVKPYIGYTFATGLRSILRQDPNIIMVGEIRDRETAEMAVQSALTGHLVLSTLHTNGASGAIPRLIDMGVEPFLISSSLHTIIAQRLVRKLCPACKAMVEMPEAVFEDIKKEFDRIPDQYKQGLQLDPSNKKMYKAVGCSTCGNSGYKGRIGIYELLRVSEKIQYLTTKRASSADILNQALSEGMITMKQDGVLKAMQGITTIEEVYRVTNL